MSLLTLSIKAVSSHISVLLMLIISCPYSILLCINQLMSNKQECAEFHLFFFAQERAGFNQSVLGCLKS